MFDRLAYIDKLKGAGIDEPVARAHAEALDTALRDGVATHGDMVAVRSDLRELEHRFELRFVSIERRLGALVIVLSGLLFGALHVWPPHP